MDDTLTAALVHLAGLDVAWRDFRDDVRAAATQATGQASGVVFPTDPAAEPWPPMQAKSVL